MNIAYNWYHVIFYKEEKLIPGNGKQLICQTNVYEGDFLVRNFFTEEEAAKHAKELNIEYDSYKAWWDGEEIPD